MTIRELLRLQLGLCSDLDKEAKICILHRDAEGTVTGYQYCPIVRVRIDDSLSIEASALSQSPIGDEQ